MCTKQELMTYVGQVVGIKFLYNTNTCYVEMKSYVQATLRYNKEIGRFSVQEYGNSAGFHESFCDNATISESGCSEIAINIKFEFSKPLEK